MVSPEGIRVGVLAAEGVCSYCCTRPATTRDHVPPKALLKGTSAHRITVPSCGRCNCGESDEDAYLRLTISADVGADSHPAADPAWEASYRGLQRPEAIRLKRAFYQGTQVMDFVDKAGERRGQVLTYQVSGPRQGRVTARVLRGLHFHATGCVLPDHHVIAMPYNFLAQKEREPRTFYETARRMAALAEATAPVSVCGEVVRYWAHAQENVIAWWLVYFGGLPFLGIAMPKRPGASLSPWWRPFEFPSSEPD